MSLTNIEQVMPVKLAQALANPLFPALDSALRSGRHIGLDELDNHAFLMDFQEYLEEFYARYNVELIRAPEGSSTCVRVLPRLFRARCYPNWI